LTDDPIVGNLMRHQSRIIMNMISPQLDQPSLYAAFDVFPSAKGSATHIHHAARHLFEFKQGGLLFALGNDVLPNYQEDKGVEIIRFSRPVPNFLRRTMQFGGHLASCLSAQAEHLKICQFRDPWSGIPILAQNDRRYHTVYEVNGLPSIELPALYPKLGQRTQAKIRALEQHCYMQSDRVVTPSQHIAQHLVAQGVPESKISVIANGADSSQRCAKNPHAPERYLLYFGALQPWQGVDVLLKAFAQLADLTTWHLVICSSIKSAKEQPYRKLAEKLGVAERVIWQSQLPKDQLASWLQHAYLTVAPLTTCERNVQQGCCPLKILESMAVGVPVVASNLPVVQEIISSPLLGRLVPPDRPSDLARAIRVLIESPEQVAHIGKQARRHIQSHFSWQHNQDKTRQMYQDHHCQGGAPAQQAVLSIGQDYYDAFDYQSFDGEPGGHMDADAELGASFFDS